MCYLGHNMQWLKNLKNLTALCTNNGSINLTLGWVNFISHLVLKMRIQIHKPQTRPHTPSSASISFIKCPFPIPPNDGLHDISPERIEIEK